MKVLHFYRTYFPDSQGGLEEVIRQICLATKDLGVENRILTLSRNPVGSPIQMQEAVVYQVKLHAEVASCSISLNALSIYEELVDWADLVHLHYPWPFADLVHLLKTKLVPSVVTYHSDIVRQSVLKLVYKPLETAFLNSVDAVVATSPNYLNSSDKLKKYSEKTHMIPIGIDENSYPDVDKEITHNLRNKYGQGFFFFIGVLRYYKGLDFLISAMEGQPFSLVIAGIGPEEHRLKSLVSDLGLTNVRFTGYVSDQEKVSFYNLCRAVILPSYLRSEAYGVTLVEGAMASKPLISADINTGTTYVNTNGETGIVVKPGDVASLRDAMITLSADDQLVTAMGRAARDRFDKKLTADIMGSKYFKLYQMLIPAGKK